MRMKVTELVVISILSLLVVIEPARAWMAEWATYKNPSLAPNEEKAVFECCRNVEQPECGDSLMENEIFLVDINSKELRPLTFDIEDFWISPDKSKVLIQTHYGLYLLNLLKRSLPKEIFNRFPSGGFDSRCNSILNVSWSPDSKMFLFIRAIGFDGKRVSSIFDSETCKETVLNLDLFPCAVGWQPSGTAIYYDQGGTINYLDLTNGETGEILFGYPEDPCHDPIISPDGGRVLYRASQSFKIRTGGYREKITLAQWVELPTWASKELKEAIWHGHKELIKEMQYILLDGPISNLRFIWSQDGERILIKDKDEIWLYTLSDSSYLPIHCDSNTITEITWSPNQNEIYFVSQYQKDTNQDGVLSLRDKTFSDLNVFNLQENSLKTLLSEKDSLRNLAFSSDGLLLAYETGGNIWILNTSILQTHPLTTSGGTKANWLANDKTLLFENKKSLYIVDKNGQNLTHVTIAKGKEPVWLSNNEIAVKSGGKHWKVALDKLEVKEIIPSFKTTPRSKGKKYEVYITDNKFGKQPWVVSEIWIKEIQTSKAWKNY
jgi:hypothetical protein